MNIDLADFDKVIITFRPIGLYVPNSASASTCTAGHVPTTTICASQKMETAPYLVVTISRHRTVVP